MKSSVTLVLNFPELIYSASLARGPHCGVLKLGVAKGNSRYSKYPLSIFYYIIQGTLYILGEILIVEIAVTNGIFHFRF